jgi:DNA ligase-1
MRLIDLVEASASVSRTASRLEKVAILAGLLRRLAPDEVPLAIAFLSGTPGTGRIGVGGALLRRAERDAANEPTLDITSVGEAFHDISRTGGRGSSAERERKLGALFARATTAEQDFLARLIFGELRQGALEGVLIDAVARAASVPPASVRRAAMMSGDLGSVARAAMASGEAGLLQFSVMLMRPVDPMLADSADTVAAALGRLRRAAFEWKLDGARIQMHKDGDTVRVFTRNLRDVTQAVPEVVAQSLMLAARSAILDGEVIALREDGAPHPFQITMRRFGRRLEVDRLRSELPLTPFFFDCLLRDGEPLIDRPQSARFSALSELAPAAVVIPHVITADVSEAQTFANAAIARGHEGVVAKALDAPYAAGRRGQAWLKIKQAKTLDLVVLAAEWGNGRRQGWLSNLHLGARDEERGGFVMLGKTFKGLTDEMLQWQTEQFLTLESHRDSYTVYVRPELVVEIAFNDLQESPHYPGGLALRFARVKGYRPDKSAGEADTFATVQEVYRQATGLEPPKRI